LASRRGATDGSSLDPVPDTPHGLDQLMLLVAELLPEVSDVDLDVFRIAEEVVAPDLVEDAIPGQHLVRMHHQQPQKIELARRQTDRTSGPPHLAGGLVHGDLQPLELRPGRRIPAAHDRPDPGQQFAEVERLDQVVVGAHLQPLDPVLDLILRRQDDDAGVLVAADGFGDGAAVELRHHYVAGDPGGSEVGDQAEPRMAVRRGVPLRALVLQAEADEVDDAALVVNDEDPRAAGRRDLGSRLRHLSPNITLVLAKPHLLGGFSGGSQKRTSGEPLSKLSRCSRLTPPSAPPSAPGPPGSFRRWSAGTWRP